MNNHTFLSPPYSKILHYSIEIVFAPPESLKFGNEPIPLSLCFLQDITYALGHGPIPPCRIIVPIDYGPMIGLCTLGPFPYPVEIRAEPTYLGLVGHEGGPGRPLLVLLPLQILPQIGNRINDPYYGLGYGIALPPSILYQPPPGFVN